MRKINEDYFDDIETGQFQENVTTDSDADSQAEACDLKLICYTELTEDWIDIDALERYVRRLETLLEKSKHITAYVKPQISTVSKSMLKSSGGKFPDDRVRYVGDIGKEYNLHRGIFVEFQIRTSFYDVSQSMRFLKSVVDLSKVIPSLHKDFPGTFVNFTNTVYIHSKFVKPSRDYDTIAFHCTKILIKRGVEEPTSFVNNITTPALLMCPRRRDAYGKILDETKLNIFSKSENLEAPILLEISFTEFINYKSVELLLSLKKKMMNSFSYSGLKGNGKKIKILLKNAAYDDDKDESDAQTLEKWGSERTQLVLKWLREQNSVKNISLKIDYTFQNKPACLFVWVGWCSLEDTYTTGFNTYNVFIAVSGETETLEMIDRFVEMVGNMLPGTDSDKLKEIILNGK